MLTVIWSKIKAFFSKIWAACFKSATMAWSYVLGIFSAFLQNIDAIASAMGDPNLNQQMASFFGDAKTLGKWLMAVAVVNVIARARSMIVKKD